MHSVVGSQFSQLGGDSIIFENYIEVGGKKWP